MTGSGLSLFSFISSILEEPGKATAMTRAATNEESHKESDKVRALPGQPPVNYGQYAGYVHVGREKERACFIGFLKQRKRQRRSLLFFGLMEWWLLLLKKKEEVNKDTSAQAPLSRVKFPGVQDHMFILDIGSFKHLQF